MPAKYVGKGGGEEATPEHLAAMIPDEHREFVAKVLDDAGIPPLPADYEQRTRKAAGLNVDAEGPGQIEVCLAHPNVKMIVNALGPPPAYVVEQAHDNGLLVGALAGSRAARRAQRGDRRRRDRRPGHRGRRPLRRDLDDGARAPDRRRRAPPTCRCSAAGGIADGRQMAAAMALGAQGVWTGSVWLLTQEADMYPEVTANLLAATSSDAIRSRVMTGKPARQLRTKWTEAWEQPGAPAPLPMPLQGLLYGEAATRFSRVHSKDFAGHPVGQIVGSIDQVKPARQVVLDMVEQWISTVERLEQLMVPDDA